MLIKALTNPLKAKLLLEIYAKKQSTAKLLNEKFPDIPLPTIYRHLKQMHNDGVLMVAKESPIRGTIEKAYALALDLTDDKTKKMLKENDGAAYINLFTQFMMGIANEFSEYCLRKDKDILNDGSGFTIAPIYASVDEITELLMKIGELLQPLLNNEPSVERKLHNLCIITTPPKG